VIFYVDILRKVYEKNLLLTSVIFRGDYRSNNVFHCDSAQARKDCIESIER